MILENIFFSLVCDLNIKIIQMKNILIAILVAITFSILLCSCSDNSPVNSNPLQTDTSAKYINLTNRISDAGGLSEQLREIEVIGANFWITCIGKIFISRDSAKTFTMVRLPIEYYSRIFMYNDALNGWCINDTLVLKTSNGGYNWNAINFAARSYKLDDISFFQKEFTQDNVGYITGSKNNKSVIFKTVNGGDTWSLDTVSLSNLAGLKKIFLLNNDLLRTHCFISSQSGIYKSTNQGLNWAQMQINSGSGSFGGVYFKDQLTGWAAGYGGSFYKCNFNTWTQVPSNSSNNFYSLDFAADGINGWAVGEGNEYAHTTNGGDSWQMEGYGYSHSIMYDVKVISSKEAYFVGYASTFYKFIKP